MTVSSGTLKTRNINFASLFCTRFQQYHANKALRYFVRSLTVFFFFSFVWLLCFWKIACNNKLLTMLTLHEQKQYRMSIRFTEKLNFESLVCTRKRLRRNKALKQLHSSLCWLLLSFLWFSSSVKRRIHLNVVFAASLSFTQNVGYNCARLNLMDKPVVSRSVFFCFVQI